jgi:spermidine/putrescine transport system permease protein
MPSSESGAQKPLGRFRLAAQKAVARLQASSAKRKAQAKNFFSLKRKYLAIPYAIFLLLFVIVPLLMILWYAFTDANGTPSFQAAKDFFSSPSKWSVLLVSLFMGLQTTGICLLLGYPAAYFLADKKFNSNRVLVVLFIMPMWINSVIRIGATRDLLLWLGLSGGEYPWAATLIGMVYDFIPFTILPLYTTMLKIDKAQLEAAADLGASPRQVFLKSTLPQSLPGIVSASQMVFMPVMSSYVISDTLSEGKITLFGNSIYLNFANSQWNAGSFMAIVMLVIVGVTMLLTSRFEQEHVSARGEGLW